MRKKIVLLVLGCIVVLGSSAVPANAVNTIFSDDFNGWRVDNELYYYFNWGLHLPSNWDVFFIEGTVSWFDIAYEQHPAPFHEDANDRQMVLEQWDTTGAYDVWMVTKEYYNVTLCTQLAIDVNWVMKPTADVNIIKPIVQVKALYYDNNHNSKGEAIATIADHNSPRGTDPNVAYVWNHYAGTLPVPSGATLVKFEFRNLAIDLGHGAFWFDDFVVTDPVCVNRPSMDLNRDCKVNFADLATFALQWHNCGLVIQGSVTRCW